MKFLSRTAQTLFAFAMLITAVIVGAGPASAGTNGQHAYFCMSTSPLKADDETSYAKWSGFNQSGQWVDNVFRGVDWRGCTYSSEHWWKGDVYLDLRRADGSQITWFRCSIPAWSTDDWHVCSPGYTAGGYWP